VSLWIAIVLLTLIALVALVGPLIRRAAGGRDDHDRAVYQDQLNEIDRDLERGVLNQAEAEALKTEISRRMIKAADTETGEDAAAQNEIQAGGIRIVPAVFLIVIVPLAALGLYRHLGSPDKPDMPYASRTFAPTEDQSQAQASAEMNSLVDNLKRRMEQNPEKLDGWLLLGRSLMSLERFGEAAEAYTKAHHLANQPKLVRADITASLAEAAYMAAGGRFTPLIRDYLTAARAAAPRESKVLFYLGLDLARQKNYGDAVQIWTDLLAITPPQAPWRANLQQQITKAAKAGGIDAAAVKPQLAPVQAMAPAGPTAEDVKAAGEMTDEDRQAFIRSMVARLAERLKDAPGDIDGWKRLARAYEVLGETEKAAEAVKRIRQLEGNK